MKKNRGINKIHKTLFCLLKKKKKDLKKETVNVVVQQRSFVFCR